MFQADQLLDAAFDVGAMRLVFSFEIAQLRLELGAKSAQAAGPAVASANYGGVHQQSFPAQWDIERMLVFRSSAASGVWKVRKKLVVRRDPLRRAGLRRAVGVQGRHLAERKIFSEARRGAAVAGAGQQCEKGSAGGIGTGSAAAK